MCIRDRINADDKKNTTKDAVKSVTATYQNSVITIHYNEEYKVVQLENDKDIPTGFGKTEIVLRGHVITAYATEDNLEHKFVLIYCKCGRQEPEFYPVSYTHLDVYKRQPQYSGLLKLPVYY